MPEPLYNMDYLEQTTRLLKNLKQTSYQPFAACTGGTIADIGCGTGADALNLLKMLEGKVAVLGIDHDELMVGKAQTDAAGQEGIRFETGDATRLSLADNSLAGIRAERLIQHIPAPEQTYAEFNRVLQPGAPVVIVETDWNSITFYNGDAGTAHALNRYLTQENVNNGLAAANVIKNLQGAGFRDINLEIFPFSSRSLDQVVAILRIDYALQQMEARGRISTDVYDSFLAALRDADQNRYFACTINLVVASAIK